jgi:drug/metabolite transporter (DMT)-like permease
MEALLYSIGVGLFWGASTLIARYSGAGPYMMAILISIGGLITMLPLIPGQDFAATGGKAIAIGVVAGIVNGLGLLAFYKLVGGANEGLWELSRVIPIAMVLVPIVVTVGARFVFAEPFTPTKLVGIALACAAIWFLE